MQQGWVSWQDWRWEYFLAEAVSKVAYIIRLPQLGVAVSEVTSVGHLTGLLFHPVLAHIGLELGVEQVVRNGLHR